MATRQVLLRSGDARDVATVDALMAASFDPRFGEAWTHGQVLGVLAMPGVALTLAEIDDRPAGFAMVRTIADEAELLLLAVAPRCRRQGVGSSLLRGVVHDAQAAGLVAIHLEVRAGNAAGQLYTRHDFVKVGERRGYYRGRGGTFDAWTFRRAMT